MNQTNPPASGKSYSETRQSGHQKAESRLTVVQAGDGACMMKGTGAGCCCCATRRRWLVGAWGEGSSAAISFYQPPYEADTILGMTTGR